ncbi:hypothetical protein BS78_09G024600 [Paspalum vaginatum]|nr:hypothetical protein BS78_09G024600 [Paspalum vaginatum]
MHAQLLHMLCVTMQPCGVRCCLPPLARSSPAGGGRALLPVALDSFASFRTGKADEDPPTRPDAMPGGRSQPTVAVQLYFYPRHRSFHC